MKNFFKKINYSKYYRDILPYLKKQKNQEYFTIILTISASIFFALFAISPTLSTIAKLKKEVVDAKFVDEKLTQKINALSSLSQAYQEIEPDIPVVLDAVPEKADAPNLVAQIQSVAADTSVGVTNIEISQIDLTTPNVASLSSTFAFKVVARSDYRSLSQFITQLTSMQRVVSIDSISLTKGATEDQDLDANISGTAYFKK